LRHVSTPYERPRSRFWPNAEVHSSKHLVQS
jgi:hypothetical protein